MSDQQLPADCVRVCAELSRWVDEELEVEQQATLEQHIAACATCRATMTLLRLVRQAARQVPRLEPREELRDRVLARIEAEAARPAAEGRMQRMELYVVERPGQRMVHQQEIGAWREAVFPLRPGIAFRSMTHLSVHCHRHERGTRTVLSQVVEND